MYRCAIFSVYVDLVHRMVAFTVKVRDVLLDDSTVLFYFFRIMFLAKVFFDLNNTTRTGFRVLLQKLSLFLVLSTCKYFHFKLGSSFIQKRWSYAFKTPWLYSYLKHVWSFLMFGTNTFCFNPCQSVFVPRLALIYPVSHDVI